MRREIWAYYADLNPSLTSPKNISRNQSFAGQEDVEWHYKPVIGDSADQFSDSSGCGADAQRAIDRQQIGFGDGGFAHMQRSPVALLPVLVCRVNMPTIVQQKQGDRPRRA